MRACYYVPLMLTNCIIYKFIGDDEAGKTIDLKQESILIQKNI